MNLQTELQTVINRIKTDSCLLHKIVHGDDQTIISTDGGDIKSAAKIINDMEKTLQAGLIDLNISSEQLNNIILKIENYRDEAQSSAQTALQTAKALNLPTNIQGQAGNLLAVKQSEDGFEAIKSIGVFYGLRTEGAKLKLIIAQGTFNSGDFDTWFITLPGLELNINENGHLVINL